MDFPGVDVEAATRAGIKVAKIPSANTGNAVACAEHSIYLILGLLRNQVERVICCWMYLLLFWSFWLIFDTWTDSFCSSKTILGQVLVDGNQLEFQCFIYHTLQVRVTRKISRKLSLDGIWLSFILLVSSTHLRIFYNFCVGRKAWRQQLPKWG